ncbi:peroxiredoxin, Ohr subfamily [Lentilactobacillus parafarraginis F0439]|uniref:Peroxiredoxin, Ohr subfamily n=1 Tax=Lentilactobacillus parafarraginis F0439 TaxID=797515 RepID=G9ZSY7_9LACO|nr:OsmC family protein [Lentilactobacillus parafarraginis]EHL95704.1 peroxiredoxin, Ohr subfamily [Lentilactobacillus parafarraginis F0439]
MDTRWNDPLYTTTGINSEGLEGHAYVPNGLNVKTSNPLNSHPGTNPEQLLSLSLSTCLEATLEAIEREHHLPHTSEVRVHVAFIGSRASYQFLVHAQIKVAGVDFATAQAMTAEAEHRCPVSKLLANSGNYTVETVTEFTDPK